MSPEVAAGRLVPPPFFFKPPSEVRTVAKLGPAQEPTKKRWSKDITEARKAGLRYERAAREHLRQVLPGAEFGTWWQYYDGETSRNCQTDAIWVHPDQSIVSVFEIKRLHTTDAWWQLRRLYELVVRSYYGSRVNVNVLEMCWSFDPDISYPEEIVLVDDVKHWCSFVRHQFGVYRWRP